MLFLYFNRLVEHTHAHLQQLPVYSGQISSLPVSQYSSPHLWSWALSSHQKNGTVTTNSHPADLPPLWVMKLRHPEEAQSRFTVLHIKKSPLRWFRRLIRILLSTSYWTSFCHMQLVGDADRSKFLLFCIIHCSLCSSMLQCLCVRSHFTAGSASSLRP